MKTRIKGVLLKHRKELPISRTEIKEKHVKTRRKKNEFSPTGAMKEMNSCPTCGGKIVHKTVKSNAFWGKYKIKVFGIEVDVCENCNEQFMSIEELEKLADTIKVEDYL